MMHRPLASQAPAPIRDGSGGLRKEKKKSGGDATDDSQRPLVDPSGC